MATPLLVLIILAIVIIASIITSVVTYVILSGRNKRIRLAEQYRQLGITEQYLKIQDEIERIIRYKDIKLTTASPVKMSNPEDGQNEKETESGTFADDIWFIVRGKDRKTSEKLLEYWHFICENSEWNHTGSCFIRSRFPGTVCRFYFLYYSAYFYFSIVSFL